MFNPDNNYEKFENKVWLSSPTMYPDSMRYVMEAYETNWMSTVGENINEVERMVAEKIGVDPAVMASPLISTITDAVSLLIYFTIAKALLHF